MALVFALQQRLPRSRERLERELQGSGVRRWLYFGDDSNWRVSAERSLLAGLPRVETAELLQETAWRLRQPFIDWIGSLSAENESLEWWASELAAKSSHTMFYNRVCSLGVARHIIASDPAPSLIVCSSPALLEEARAHAVACGHPVCELSLKLRPGVRTGLRSAQRRIENRGLRLWSQVMPPPLQSLPARASRRAETFLATLPGYRRGALLKAGFRTPGDFAGPDTVLLLTWVDDRSVDDSGRYVDPHLGALPSLLKERGFRVGYLARVLPTNSFDATVSRLAATGETMFFPELLVDEEDVAESERRARSFRPRIPAESSVLDVPVVALAREHVELHRPIMGYALVYEAVVRNLARLGISPGSIIHTYEGHSWEQVLAAAVRTHLPATRLIGYENVNMSRLALSMYPAKSEYGLRPLPDRIVTNGPRFREVLLAEGVPELLVRTGCGIRHGNLREVGEEPVPRRDRKNAFRILVATEVAVGQAVELVEKALLAFGNDERYEMTVKCHPLLGDEPVLAALGPLAAVDNLRFSNAAIDDLLRDADAMLYTYSVVGYEALAHGVPPVFVRSETVLDLDQLEPFAELRRDARSPEELRRAVEEIAALGYHALEVWSKRAKAAAREALAPVSAGCVEAFIG